MGSPNEPPRKVDLKKWDATWERIRAKQAADKIAAAPTVPEHLPPLPPGTRYGGVLDDYEGYVNGYVCDSADGLGWGYSGHWHGTKGVSRDGCPDAQWSGLWHVAFPIDEQP